MVGKNKVLCSISTDRVHLKNVYLYTVFLQFFSSFFIMNKRWISFEIRLTHSNTFYLPANFISLSVVISSMAQELSWTHAKSCPVAADIPAIVLLTHTLAQYEPALCAPIWRAWKHLFKVEESTFYAKEKINSWNVA